MVAFGHTAVGVIVGISAYNLLGHGDITAGLVLTGTAGVISHYLADLVPHGHFFKHSKYKSEVLKIIIFDLFLSVVLFLLASHLLGKSPVQILYILFGIGGSQLPDILDGLIYIDLLPKKGLIKWENNFHQWTHWHGSLDKALLIDKRDIWQVAVVILAFIYLYA